MKIKTLFILMGFFAFLSCSNPNKSKISGVLNISEPEDWILVVNPEGCKTCLDSFYSELQLLPKDSPGTIVLIAKNSKTLRQHPLIEKSPIPLYLDEQKILIEEELVQMTDQILLFRGKGFTSFDILDYENALSEIR
ncbi:hypothetical protein GYM62_00340 [Algoriphagus sp. NBT04N3]|uniref:hypothetical protein n=1 Tax=Algoriphagus sp. NBT04N3 TaxID=2705473 RepID=UPI001C635406|nr:hypothetical protein [Algoriphagus sp. NBT04N3]QYH37335.1 hypothetical protein GYM62_00340 [Algoriphagus sp. NBT04N3]